MLIALVIYRLIDPGSEWRLHRQWYEQSALGDLLGEDFGLVAKDNLYRCLDRLVQHREELFKYLRGRWQDEFGAKFDVLLYDLTSTYFESDPPFAEGDKRRFGYSRDKRFALAGFFHRKAYPHPGPKVLARSLLILAELVHYERLRDDQPP